MPYVLRRYKGSTFLLLCSLIFLPFVSYALTPEEEYKKIQQDMIEQKKKLGEAQKKEYSVLNELEQANKKLSIIEGELRISRKKLKRTESEIAAVNSELIKNRAILEKQTGWLKRKLRLMHKFGYSGDTILMLLSADNISQMMRTWKYLENITRHEHKILGNYRENLRSLDEKNNKLLALKEEFIVNEKHIKTKEAELSKKKRGKEIILSSVRHEKARHLAMIKEMEKASKKLQDIISESSKTDTFSSTGFSRLKGKLPWPVEGSIALPYGSQKDPQFDTPVFRHGIHIQTDNNSDARAVSSGKVIFAEWFKGFGKLVIVNHGGGYHTLYGNLSEIFSIVGDIIQEDQTIGQVGTSGILNAPGLYFEIIYKGKPLDPTQWLKRKKS
ncbi:MAG: hypothetical protein A2X59_08775 [Nitrospirae bacterium GWC2_42_7]|nr:MAG: hypothetical protein A2X59_08775 [Nitrospirae bacterium GWC2_42_7]